MACDAGSHRCDLVYCLNLKQTIDNKLKTQMDEYKKVRKKFQSFENDGTLLLTLATVQTATDNK